MARDVVLPPGYASGLVATPEWNFVCARHHNVLLEGPEASTDVVLSLLEPHLRSPVVWRWSRSPLELPTHECGALILRDVAALTASHQTGLLRWLDDANHRRQVVSTTVRPLFPLVGRGLFDEALYYRLNVMLLRIGSTGLWT